MTPALYCGTEILDYSSSMASRKAFSIFFEYFGLQSLAVKTLTQEANRTGSRIDVSQAFLWSILSLPPTPEFFWVHCKGSWAGFRQYAVLLATIRRRVDGQS